MESVFIVTTGKLIYIITMGWTLIIMGGITYLFKKKGDFSFLNGFSNRPEEEKLYLEESGYLDAIGNLFAASFWIFLVTFIVGLLPIPYAFGIGITIFIVHLMIGLIWIQRYEVPHKRKKMIAIMSLLSAGILIFIAIMFGMGLIENDVKISEKSIEISGMYGDEWDFTEIERIELVDELPEVLFKTNGFAMTNILKGKFTLEEPYGNGLLFINGRGGPFLVIFTADEYVIIKKKDNEETVQLYKELIGKVNG